MVANSNRRKKERIRQQRERVAQILREEQGAADKGDGTEDKERLEWIANQQAERERLAMRDGPGDGGESDDDDP